MCRFCCADANDIVQSMDDARFAHACRLYMYVHSRIACNNLMHYDVMHQFFPIIPQVLIGLLYVLYSEFDPNSFCLATSSSIKTHAFSFASFSLLFSVILGAHQTFQICLNAKPQCAVYFFFFNFNRLTSWMMNGFLFNVLVFFCSFIETV